MPKEVRREYLLRLQERYLKSNKVKKALILDEFCESFEYTRKHAIRLLNTRIFGSPPRTGPKLTYGAEVVKHLAILWEAMGYVNSKKMVGAMPHWIPFYEGGDDLTRYLLLKISASTIDRKLTKLKAERNKGLSTTTQSIKLFSIFRVIIIGERFSSWRTCIFGGRHVLKQKSKFNDFIYLGPPNSARQRFEDRLLGGARSAR